MNRCSQCSNRQISDETALYGSTADYGSYEMLANLTVAISGVDRFTNYRRALDLETAVHTVEYTANGAQFSTYAR